MREALEIIADLQAKYIDLNDYKKHACLDLNKCLPLKDPNSDDEGGSPDVSKSALKAKLNREVDLDELDAKELKRIKTLKKRRKLQHSFLFAGNLKQWEENIKHRDYCDIKPGAQYWFKTALQDFDQRDRRAIN